MTAPGSLLFIRTYVVDWIISLLRSSMAYSLEDVTVQGDKQWKILQMLWQVHRNVGKKRGDTWCKLNKSKENLQSWGPELNEASWEESEDIPDIINGMGNDIELGETMYSQGTRLLEVAKDKLRQGVDGLWRAITSHEEPELIAREMKKSWRALNRGVMWNAVTKDSFIT